MELDSEFLKESNLAPIELVLSPGPVRFFNDEMFNFQTLGISIRTPTTKYVSRRLFQVALPLLYMFAIRCQTD